MTAKFSPRDMLVETLRRIVASFRSRLDDEILLSAEEDELTALIEKTEAFLRNEFNA